MTTIGRRPRGPAVLCLLVSVLLPFIAEVWNAEAAKQKLTFPMVPSSDAIKSCLPNATATVTVTGAKNNQIMEIKADRKSTRLNSSHLGISYAVFCLKKKKNK